MASVFGDVFGAGSGGGGDATLANQTAILAAIAAMQIDVENILDDTGTDIPAAITAVTLKLGTPSSLGSGADLSNMLQDMAGDGFDNSTDSLEDIKNATGGAGGSGVTYVDGPIVGTVASGSEVTAIIED